MGYVFLVSSITKAFFTIFFNAFMAFTTPWLVLYVSVCATTLLFEDLTKTYFCLLVARLTTILFFPAICA